MLRDLCSHLRSRFSIRHFCRFTMLPRRHRNTRVVEDHTVAQSARVLETRYQRLAADVKKLTNEVSRLTERREKLQLEIADLMRLKAEHTVDTAVIHDSKGPNLGASRPDPSTPSTSAFHDQPRKSAWRPVVPHQRALDRYKGKPPPSSGTVSKRSKLSARPPLVSWASWMPNAIFMPT
ncbi:hypothetical protein CERSUDRAFT_114679, partial [Gelatoporia subvermispora B]